MGIESDLDNGVDMGRFKELDEDPAQMLKDLGTALKEINRLNQVINQKDWIISQRNEHIRTILAEKKNLASLYTEMRELLMGALTK